MAVWMQSLSWALLCSLVQGLVVYTSLWLSLRLMPALPAGAKYRLSLSALSVLFAWFAATWWQQYHTLQQAQQLIPVFRLQHVLSVRQQLQAIAAVDGYNHYPSLVAQLSFLFPWLSAAYLTGLGIMLLRLSAGIAQLHTFRSKGITPVDAAYTVLLEQLKDRLHIKGSVQLYRSARARVPMVVGFLKPVILMPVAAIAQLSTEQLETILLHELAHIRRHDYLINIVQTIAETILFFNPFVWLVSSIIRREREHCCDDLVLTCTPEPLCYATALAAVAGWQSATATLAIAATGQHRHLLPRIRRIMETRKTTFSYSRMVAALFLIAGITCSIAWLSPSFTGAKHTPAAATKAEPKAAAGKAVTEETLLINRLIQAQLVDEVKGFVVEKLNDQLYINRQLQPAAVAAQYLAGIKKQNMRIQVFPLLDRMKQHPQSGFIQVLLPTTLESPCVDYDVKPGC